MGVFVARRPKGLRGSGLSVFGGSEFSSMSSLPGGFAPILEVFLDSRGGL